MEHADPRPDSRAALVGLAIALLALTSCQAPSWPDGPWAYPTRGRVCLRVEAGGVERNDRQAEIDLDVARLLREAGLEGELAVDSVRVVEIDADGAALDPTVPRQMDPDADGEARATLIFTLTGTTPAEGVRYYQVYFDVDPGVSSAAPEIAARVRIETDVPYGGQESYRIETLGIEGGPTAVYYYHPAGAGFAGMVDRDGRDWIAHGRAKDHLGEWRGIPNLGWEGAGDDPGFGHPGYTTAESEVVHAGPLKVTLRSGSLNGRWECYWEITPDRAKLTVTKVPADQRYWFLYEGTPGGELDGDDLCVRGDGRSTPLDQGWGQDLRKPEWVYFASRASGRSLFLAHLDNDWREDSYFRLRSMTVFGFGRGSGDDYLEGLLSTVPDRFVIGFAEVLDHADVSRVAASARVDPRIVVGPTDRAPDRAARVSARR